MKIGYKATYNYKCLDQTYEIGQEYKIDEKPEVCKKGFHYCKEAENVLTYYPIQPGFKLLEIEDLSNETIHEVYKSCSNHIKIIREINDPEEMMNLLKRNFTYDESTKTLKQFNFDGFWYEHTYNELGEALTYKNSNGIILLLMLENGNNI